MSDNPYFLNLKSKHIDDMKKISYIKQCSYGEKLFEEGDKPINLYVLISGTIKTYKANSKSDYFFLREFQAGELIGVIANFADICYPETAKFTSKGEILVINFNIFKEKLLQDSEVLEKITTCLLKKKKIAINIA